MFRYYKEIDNDFYLPVIVERNTDHILDNTIVDNDFLNKYNKLFDFINYLSTKINDFLNFNSTSDESLAEYLKHKLSMIKSNDVQLNKSLTIEKLEQFLLLWSEVIDLLDGLHIFSCGEYIEMMQEFYNALLEIGYKRKKVVDAYLPNIWFITSKGFLYNVRSTQHSAGYFRNYYEELTKKFLKGELKFKENKANTGKIDLFLEYTNLSILNTQGYVGYLILDAKLHYLDYIRINGKIFDPKYITIVQGMIGLEKDYYNFLEKLYNNTNNPIEELNKIIKLTLNNYDDILIRCCGCSKITSSPSKTIVTSRFDYETAFKEYIENGWNISLVSPIIINESKGIVEEDDDFFKIKQIRKIYYHRS